MLALPVRREVVDDAGPGGPRPWPLVADVGPDAALLYPSAQSPAASGPVEHPDRRIVRVHEVAGQYICLDPFDHRMQSLHRPPAPIDQRGVGDIRAHAGEDLGLPVERQTEIFETRMCASRPGPAMLPGMGRLGAGLCTMRS